VNIYVSLSIFENGPIPYPKREFLTDDENEEKADTATSKVSLFKSLLFFFDIDNC